MRTFLKPIAALLAIGVVMIAFAVGLAALPTRAADHLDAPGTKVDSRLDINDVYAFKSPANSANTVLIMTVNPVAGVNFTTFHPNASYEFLIDGNADAKPDTTIELDFGKVKDGVQSVEIEIDGPQRDVEAEGRTGRTIKISGGGKLRAGLFDDPFFFDLANFNLGAKFCGAAGGLPVKNFFKDLNVSAIVLEVPSAWLDSDSNIGVWARTVLGGTQIDRMGRPAINTVFIPPNPFEAGSTSPGNPEDAFNATKPKNDVATWTAEVVNTLLFLSSLDGSAYSTAEANAIAGVLLPDILTIDTSSSAGFVTGPLNGRQLADDVIDLELVVVTGGFPGTPAVASDCVANDSAFPGSFPYLAPKN